MVSSDDLGGSPDATKTGPLLKFAVFGDARPPLPEDSSHYPTEILKAIFALAAAQNVQFVVGTGDYFYALSDAAVTAQLAKLKEAEAPFVGPIYHALGNHECLTSSTLNCPNANESPLIKAFMANLIPSGTLTPYYRVDQQTRFGVAKFLFVAGNAWTDAQGDWLKAALAEPTAYTFVIRHIPTGAPQEAAWGVTAPGVKESDAILDGAPMTNVFFGHEHVFKRIDPQHVISGNGGAPLGSKNDFYGLLIVEQQADGNFALTELDVATAMPKDSWRVTAAGQAAP